MGQAANAARAVEEAINIDVLGQELREARSGEIHGIEHAVRRYHEWPRGASGPPDGGPGVVGPQAVAVDNIGVLREKPLDHRGRVEELAGRKARHRKDFRRAPLPLREVLLRIFVRYSHHRHLDTRQVR